MSATEADRYDALHGTFRWHVPASFNLAEICCARWARSTPDAVAIRAQRENGDLVLHTYAELERDARRLAAALRSIGVGRGDRVAIVMPQRYETVVSHMAAYRLGAVAMPLSMLFGPDALEYRLNDSGTRVAIADESSIANLLKVRPECPQLRTLVGVGSAQADGDVAWPALLDGASPNIDAVGTTADDPALLIYTSGTTGPPKGALIAHRGMLGNLTGFVCSQNWFPHVAPNLAARASLGLPVAGRGKRGVESRPRRGLGNPNTASVFWSPADWAWTGGLWDALLPTLYFGRPIVGYLGRFGAERAFELMEQHRVTHAFLFPTALKAMMKAVPDPHARYRLCLGSIMSAGEAVGDAVFAYGRDALGVPINEMFGQTEVNYVVGNCAASLDGDGRWAAGWPAVPGSMGRPYPGHRVEVIDDDGNVCPRGTPGDVAVHRRDIHGHPDPVFFLGYWRNPGATAAKFTGDPSDSWCRTGDTAVMDERGYLWYQGRSDDVFKAAGYRIGPSEIENCLVKHHAVANAAVVPKPDAERGAVVKAYVVLAAGASGDAALVDELQRHVRGQLAPYEYPKEIEFIEALPMTTTGKVQRRLLRLQEEERARKNPGGPDAPPSRG